MVGTVARGLWCSECEHCINIFGNFLQLLFKASREIHFQVKASTGFIALHVKDQDMHR